MARFCLNYLLFLFMTCYSISAQPNTNNITILQYISRNLVLCNVSGLSDLAKTGLIDVCNVSDPKVSNISSFEVEPVAYICTSIKEDTDELCQILKDRKIPPKSPKNGLELKSIIMLLQNNSDYNIDNFCKNMQSTFKTGDKSILEPYFNKTNYCPLACLGLKSGPNDLCLLSLWIRKQILKYRTIEITELPSPSKEYRSSVDSKSDNINPKISSVVTPELVKTDRPVPGVPKIKLPGSSGNSKDSMELHKDNKAETAYDSGVNKKMDPSNKNPEKISPSVLDLSDNENKPSENIKHDTDTLNESNKIAHGKANLSVSSKAEESSGLNVDKNSYINEISNNQVKASSDNVSKIGLKQEEKKEDEVESQVAKSEGNASPEGVNSQSIIIEQATDQKIPEENNAPQGNVEPMPDILTGETSPGDLDGTSPDESVDQDMEVMPADREEAANDDNNFEEEKGIAAQHSVLVHEEDEQSHFFAYFLTMIIICIIGYLVFHNKQKILALALEGRSRRTTRRRPNTAGYRKLDSNLEEALNSSCNTAVSHVIY